MGLFNGIIELEKTILPAQPSTFTQYLTGWSIIKVGVHYRFYHYFQPKLLNKGIQMLGGKNRGK